MRGSGKLFPNFNKNVHWGALAHGNLQMMGSGKLFLILICNIADKPWLIDGDYFPGKNPSQVILI
jgi:hypothetical protein